MVFFISILISLVSMNATASVEKPKYIGFTYSEILQIENDMLWFVSNTNNDNVFYKILRYEMEKSSGISLENAQYFIYSHFPLVISDAQLIKRCPLTQSKCKDYDFEKWDVVNRSEQRVLHPFLKLYTPYLDRNFENSVFGFRQDRALSVSKRGQTMAVIKRDFLNKNEDNKGEYSKWVYFSQWISLARLHQIFSSEGDAITECQTVYGKTYSCDPYSNGSFYIASLALISASEECESCSDKEKIMLRLLAFDHATRTARGDESDKIVDFLKRDLSEILEKDDGELKLIKEIYRTRNESMVPGIKF